MRHFLTLLLCVMIAACNTASPAFRGSVPVRVTVEGSTFDIRVRGNRAEAIRINPEYAPRFGAMRKRSAVAMSKVSRCKVVSVKGDQAHAFGRLDCGDGPPQVRPAPIEVECVPERGTAIKEIGQIRVDLDCG